MKICSNCGTKVKQTDKFCSNCGVELRFVEEIDTQITTVKVKICDLCGEENPLELDECSHCGVRLSGKEKLIEKQISVTQKSSENIAENLKSSSQKIYQSKKKKQKIQNEENRVEKKLETRHFLMLGIFAIGLILIFVFYAHETSNTKDINIQDQQQNLETGPDLSKLEDINRLESELKNDPDNKEKLLHLAHLNHDSKFFEKAIGYYERYLKLNPTDNDAEVDMGVCYFELNQLDKAENIFTNVIKKNPKHQVAYFNLGVVHLNRKDLEKAKEFFKKCIELGEHTDVGHRAAELLKSH